jgi:hypothetical protein
VSFLATTGLILSAPYMLWLYWRVIYGPLTKPSLAGIKDLNRREMLMLAPLVVLVIYYGFQPADPRRLRGLDGRLHRTSRRLRTKPRRSAAPHTDAR